MASSPAQLKNSSDKLLLELIEFAQKSAHDKDLDVFEFRTKANDPDSEIIARARFKDGMVVDLRCGTAECPTNIKEFSSVNAWAAACKGRAVSVKPFIFFKGVSLRKYEENLQSNPDTSKVSTKIVNSDGEVKEQAGRGVRKVEKKVKGDEKKKGDERGRSSPLLDTVSRANRKIEKKGGEQGEEEEEGDPGGEGCASTSNGASSNYSQKSKKRERAGEGAGEEMESEQEDMTHVDDSRQVSMKDKAVNMSTDLDEQNSKEGKEPADNMPRVSEEVCNDNVSQVSHSSALPEDSSVLQPRRKPAVLHPPAREKKKPRPSEKPAVVAVVDNSDNDKVPGVRVEGAKFEKHFPRYGLYQGKVDKYNSKTNLYAVSYEDGDVEDLTLTELRMQCAWHEENIRVLLKAPKNPKIRSSTANGGGVGGRRSGGNRAGALEDAESMAVIESPPTKESPATKGKRKKVEIHNTNDDAGTSPTFASRPAASQSVRNPPRIRTERSVAPAANPAVDTTQPAVQEKLTTHQPSPPPCPGTPPPPTGTPPTDFSADLKISNLISTTDTLGQEKLQTVSNSCNHNGAASVGVKPPGAKSSFGDGASAAAEAETTGGAHEALATSSGSGQLEALR